MHVAGGATSRSCPVRLTKYAEYSSKLQRLGARRREKPRPSLSRPDTLCLNQRERRTANLPLIIFASVASHTRLLPVSGSQFSRFSQATFYHLINLIYRLNGLRVEFVKGSWPKRTLTHPPRRRSICSWKHWRGTQPCWWATNVASAGCTPALRKVEKGTDILRQGDRPHVTVMVRSGMLARYHTMPSGDRQYLSLHVAGDLPDLQSLFLGIMDHSLCAIDKAQIASIRAL
jgi:hypothetical protein